MNKKWHQSKKMRRLFLLILALLGCIPAARAATGSAPLSVSVLVVAPDGAAGPLAAPVAAKDDSLKPVPPPQGHFGYSQ